MNRRKPEGKEQVSKRQNRIRARRRDEGRVKLELWPLAEHAEAIREYARMLEAQPNSVLGSRSPNDNGTKVLQ